MEKLGGFVMLFGLVLIAMGIWRGITGTEDAIAAAVTGGVILLAGFWMVTRTGRVTLVRAVAELPVLRPAPPATEPAEPATARFSVIESIEEKVLDRVASVLATDPRITHVAEDSGRYYSNPDRDDLPEWFALRCECPADEVDQVMEDAGRLIAERLGDKARNRVSIQRY